LRNALLRVDHNTVRQHHFGFQHPSDQPEQPPIAHSLSELRGQPLVADEIEELLQIKIHAPLIAVLHMRLGPGDRRVATSARSKPVARGMERRLPQRLEHLPHGLLNNPVDHVGNPQPALPASRLGDQHAADPAGLIRPLKQLGLQPGQHDRPQDRETPAWLLGAAGGAAEPAHAADAKGR
jgi:hypothetical protein